jgi:hypothetical protein
MHGITILCGYLKSKYGSINLWACAIHGTNVQTQLLQTCTWIYISRNDLLNAQWLLFHHSSILTSWTVTVRLQQLWINQDLAIRTFKNSATTHFLSSPSRQVDIGKFHLIFQYLGVKEWRLTCDGSAAMLSNGWIWDFAWCWTAWGRTAGITESMAFTYKRMTLERLRYFQCFQYIGNFYLYR